MTSPSQYVYLTKMIRAGYEKTDVDMFAALCQQCKTDIGESREYMYLLLDMARHNECDVMDIVKSGRVSSGQRNINDKFMTAVFDFVASDDDGVDTSTKVLDLTCAESVDSSSGSYEETSSRLTSAEAYDIDDDVEDKTDPPSRVSKASTGVKRKHLTSIPEE